MIKRLEISEREDVLSCYPYGCVAVRFEVRNSMSIFSFFGGGANINEGVAEARETSGAVLVDVREADEYASGHIKDAVNVPLSDIERISSVVADRTVPLFLYCASGARSARAEKALKQMGYTNIHNIGGIRGYAGPLE